MRSLFFGIIFDSYSLYNVKIKQIMKKLLFISMLGVFAIFSSCDSTEAVDSQVDFLFKETYCANPWNNLITPEWTREQLIDSYLTVQLNVEYSDLLITDDAVPGLCLACSCLTGDNIRISADDEFLEILLETGFEIEE